MSSTDEHETVADELAAIRSLLRESPAAAEVMESGRQQLAAAVAASAATPGLRRGVSQLTRSVRPDRPRRRIALGAAVAAGIAAAVAAAAVLVGLPSGPTATHPTAGGRHAQPVTGGHQVRLTGRQILLTAAVNVARAGGTGRHRYWAIVQVENGYLPAGPTSHRYLIDSPIWQIGATSAAANERWSEIRYLGAHPVGASSWAAWRADGSPSTLYSAGPIATFLLDRPGKAVTAMSRWTAHGWTRTHPQPTGGAEFVMALGAPDYPLASVLPGAPFSVAQLARLPRAPGALKAWLLRSWDCPKMARTERPPQTLAAACNAGQVTNVLVQAAQSLLTADAPPAVKSTVYRMLADMPALHVLGGAHDPLGRPGAAIEFPDQQGGLEDEWIIDPSTGRLLATEQIVVRSGTYFGASLKAGQINGWGAYLEDGWISSLPAAPSSLPTEPRRP